MNAAQKTAERIVQWYKDMDDGDVKMACRAVQRIIEEGTEVCPWRWYPPVQQPDSVAKQDTQHMYWVAGCGSTFPPTYAISTSVFCSCGRKIVEQKEEMEEVEHNFDDANKPFNPFDYEQTK